MFDGGRGGERNIVDVMAAYEAEEGDANVMPTLVLVC